MSDKVIIKQADLVLNVSNSYDPTKLDLTKWERYLDVLCGDREYQKESIRSAIVFLASGKYSSTEDLVKENFIRNNEIQKKYTNISDYLNNLQIKNKMFANIDLATGTGKSYTMYGIAQIMLALGLVNRVLVLCPSLTIERGLIEKFINLASDQSLREAIPDNLNMRTPRIIDANSTIVEMDICVENIHAVYETTGSSIADSFAHGGEDTLVLNDESHHIFNTMQVVNARTNKGKNIKKWKEFLINPKYNFKYILGFTGTAYIDNEYFNDVIYRSSLRQAIDDKVVKTVNYVAKDDSGYKVYEKFQKIYQNHIDTKKKYNKIKPFTILVTKDIEKAEELKKEWIDFLVETEELSKQELEKKVLIVTSDSKHNANVEMLKYVDNIDNPVEWVISVSMLTEGWDVKNVFQIVPWEDRAFNSKLLISQVLGRGLRLPEQYKSPQPAVIVFNHDNWSKNIKSLVDEVLEIETRITSTVKFSGERNKFNFEVYNINYDKEEVETIHNEDEKVMDYSRVWREGIKLTSQTPTLEKQISYQDMSNGNQIVKNYYIKHRTKDIQWVIDKILFEFKIRDWEGGILGLGDNEVYSKENLPPREKIEEIVRRSMINVGILGDDLIEENSQRVFKAFSTLFRKRSKTVDYITKDVELLEIKTMNMNNESAGISSFRRGSTLFYSDNYAKEVYDDAELVILNNFFEESFLIRSRKEINMYTFKTPQNFVITNGRPERTFVEELCKSQNTTLYEAWIKSRDVGFYSIEYTYRLGTHPKRASFNPDFFIKCKQNDDNVYLVVEIKDDGDDSIENKGKYKSGKKHFETLNKKMREMGNKDRYIFHFLSPQDYHVFFEYFRDGRLLVDQNIFRCSLENMLEAD